MNMLKKAAEIIKKGGVVVAPTDTVYGLMADATNKKAVEKVFEIKKRPKNKPLPIFVKDLKMAKNLTELSSEQEKFLKKVWPGKITAVLKRKVKTRALNALSARPSTQIRNLSALGQKLKVYGVAETTIALRVPNHKTIRYLLMAIGSPLTGTSANISGQTASTKIKEVLKQFALSRAEGQPDLVIDAGNLPKSKPSKVIDLTKTPYKTLRH